MDKMVDVLIEQHEVEERIGQMAEEISRTYVGRELLVVGLLKGAAFFMINLAQRLSVPAKVDFMRVSSYGSGTESSGKLNILCDVSGDICGKDVLIVDDIIDSGYTLHVIRQLFLERGAASVAIAVLLDKVERRTVEVPVEYTGFVIPNEFIVGYGCDYDEQYRCLPFVGALKPEVYEKKK